MELLGGHRLIRFHPLQSSRFSEPHERTTVTTFSRVNVKIMEAPSVAVLMMIRGVVEKLSVKMVMEMNHTAHIGARLFDSKLGMGERK